MSGPWEKYAAQPNAAQSQGKPWEKYAQAPDLSTPPVPAAPIPAGLQGSPSTGVWQALNTPVAQFSASGRAEDKKLNDLQGGPTSLKDLQWRNDHPIQDVARQYLAGVEQRASDFGTPVGLAMSAVGGGAGRLASKIPLLKNLIPAAGVATSALFGGQGIGQLYHAATHPEMDSDARMREALAGGAGVAGGAAGLAASPIPGLAKRAIVGDVNKIIPGSNVTPLQRYNAMTSMGIEPDAAEATNSGPLRMVKQVNQNSLTAAPIYDAARAKNMQTLNLYTGDTLNKMSSLSPEDGGAAVQNALLRNQGELKGKATQGFEDLDSQVGNQPIPGAKGLQTQAQQILDQNNSYYKLHPELEPRQATSIVRNLANGGPSAKPAPTVIPGFGGAAANPPTVSRIPNYTELHRLRSDLLDFNNTNPDLVKNQANGWISQLSGAADHAITSGEGGLSPEQVGTFRDANAAWKDMKDTYDNPQNPLYSAVRTPNPSTLVNGISRTPEMAQNLKGRLGSDIGPIQRGVAEKTLGTTKEGGYNFRTFQGNFNKLQPNYRQSLYGPQQLDRLNNIGQAGTVLNEEANPSGSAKLGQKMAEVGAAGASIGHPLGMAGAAAYHAVQHLSARAMNSPTVVSALMAPAKKAGAMSKYSALYGGVASGSQKKSDQSR